MKEQIVACVNAWWGDLFKFMCPYSPDEFNMRLHHIFPEYQFVFSTTSGKNGEWILL
jgi:hypothetical protein